MTRSLALHPGATLRLLRLDSGLGLRDLARRIDVSGAYLSRIENGRDAAPTVERLEAMARELAVPATLLLDIAPRVSPLVVEYVETVPEAATLFLEIAHRRLDAAQIDRLREALRDIAPPPHPDTATPRHLCDLLTPAHVVPDLSCTTLEDALDIAAERLAGQDTPPAAELAAALRAREREVSSAIGGGVALPIVTWHDAPPRAVLITMDTPLQVDTPDGRALRTLVVLAGAPNDAARRATIVHVARLAARGLADTLAHADSVGQALAALRTLEQGALMDRSPETRP